VPRRHPPTAAKLPLDFYRILAKAASLRKNVAYSLYDCPAAMASSIHEVFSAYRRLVEGEPWYQGDHSLFLMNRRPALAITSERATELLAEVIHTAKDSPEIVDTKKLVEAAVALRDLILRLDRLPE